ncbi:MAG: lysoplasmalogenase [Spirochaetia bacterium]
MLLSVSLLILLEIVFISATVFSEIRKKRKLYVRIFKSLSSILMVAIPLILVLSKGIETGWTCIVIIAALCLSAVGDVVLTLPRKYGFLPGVAFFFSAHILYVLVFHRLSAITYVDIVSSVVLVLVAVWFFRKIKDTLGRNTVPVVLYMIIISLMLSRAVGVSVNQEVSLLRSLFILIGAFLFYMSDIILAWNEFYKPLKYHPFSMFLYYTGQIIIGISCVY